MLIECGIAHTFILLYFTRSRFCFKVAFETCLLFACVPLAGLVHILSINKLGPLRVPDYGRKEGLVQWRLALNPRSCLLDDGGMTLASL